MLLLLSKSFPCRAEIPRNRYRVKYGQSNRTDIYRRLAGQTKRGYFEIKSLVCWLRIVPISTVFIPDGLVGICTKV